MPVLNKKFWILNYGSRIGLVCFAVFLFAAHVVLGASVVVYYPKNPAPAERAAAEEFAEYWGKLTDQEVAVQPEPRRELRRPRNQRFSMGGPAKNRIEGDLAVFVGETDEAQLRVSLPTDLDKHGFRMWKRGERLILRGKTSIATQYAVSTFLEDFGGIRWYMPTELGEHIPEEIIDLPASIDCIEEPDFVSRRWGSLIRTPNDPWGRRNKTGPRDEFHHRLHQFFTQEVYDLRPDFFLMMRGERMRPDDSLRGHNLQICFGNPDAAKFAARKAAEFFDANPEAESFSLGMTDTEAICECSFCQEWIDPEKTFRQRPDYSDLVFTFMNRAAEELAKTHPDKYLGCLAYHWAENVPSFPVHPKVMPYLTADRPQWRDTDFQQEDRDLMARWMQAGPERVGIYDYYYGSSFVIPRIFTAITDASLKHAAEVGIDGFYAEINSIWSLDGPKAWLASQLLWDASKDREALLDDYYENFFGSAAVPMRNYFERSEEIWMEQEGPAFWLKFYHDFAQLELFPPEVIVELRAFLEEAKELANDRVIRERVKFISDGFRLTELYSDYYHGIKRFAIEDAEIDKLEWEVVLDRIKWVVTAREALENYKEQVIQPSDLNRQIRPFEGRVDFFPAVSLRRLLERAVRLAERGAESRMDEVVRLVEEMERTLPEVRTEAILAFAMGENEKIRLSNSDFELDVALTGLREELVGNAGYTPFSWKGEAAPGTTPVFALTDAEVRGGDFSLAAKGAVKERIYQRIPVRSGEIVRLSAWGKGRVSPGSHVDLEISWRRPDGHIITETYPARDRFWPGEREAWEEMAVVAEAPLGTDFAYVSFAVRNQGPEDFIYIDGFSVMTVR